MMQKYRADRSAPQNDGAILWWADWMGGPSLAKIERCRIESMEGNMRRTVYLTGEADTYFSVPAVCKIQGCRVTGYVTRYPDSGTPEGNLVFRHCYY